MKASPYGKLLVLAGAFLLAPGALGQCADALTWGDVNPQGTGKSFPAELFVSTRADLSNPGARALALGGAFIATADDSTSVVANPAGLGATVRPGAQLEMRYNPTVQFDRYSDKGLQDPNNPGEYITDTSSTPFFVSGVLPVGDKVVLGAFYQTMFSSDRDLNRVPSAAGKEPCYKTNNSRGTEIRVMVPLYSFSDKTLIFRTGAAAAYRAAPGLSIGASVYYASENREQVIKLADASRTFYLDGSNEGGRVEVSGSGIGFEVGLQYSPSDAFRIGAVWSSEVSFDNENPAATGPNRAENAMRTTVIPMRAGAGFAWAFHPRWSLGVDGVYLDTSAEKDELDFGQRGPAAALNQSNFAQDSTWEIRAGLEWSVVQTRTTSFTARFGGWVQTASNLRFVANGVTPSAEDKYFFDVLGVVLPKDNGDPFTHATFGFGLVSQKKWQFDVGADYEFKTSTFVASGLIGYTF